MSDIETAVRDALPASSPLRSSTELASWLELATANAPFDVAAGATWLAERLARGDLSQLEGTDLVLVAACVGGDARALARFDAVLANEVRRAVTPLDTTNTLVDEVTQLVRERLLVGDRPRLREYSGEGTLASWLRAIAVRLALNAKRPGAREEPVAAVPDQPLADPDPELALLRARYREQFKAAFANAVRTLSPRERTLLRLTHLDGLTLARVGQMYGKDASTVSRWLAGARQALLVRTREELAAVLSLSSAELDSIMRAADSQLDLSIATMLKSSAELPRP